MIANYFVRLVCLCFASFFLAYGLFSLGVALAAPAALRLAGRIRPCFAAQLLFVLRISPVGLAALFVFGLCMPSYLWSEPDLIAERVSILCLVMAALGAAICAVGIKRALSAVSRSRSFTRSCEQEGCETRVPEEPESLLVIDHAAPIFALSGIGGRSHLIVSRNLMHSLSARELLAALRHERAHRISRDNLKRLTFLLAPELFPFSRRFAGIERGWARFAEWAADDYSAGRDPGCALSLASALVCAAKMGIRPQPAPLLNSLIVDDSGLAARVDRLLSSERSQASPWSWKLPLVGGALLLTGLALMTIVFWPSILSLAYEPLERLIQ
jgi:Zn-dependent protease with chaperone function